MTVAAEWFLDPEATCSAGSPGALIDGATEWNKEVSRDGVVLIEAVDITPEAASALGEWAPTITPFAEKGRTDWMLGSWLEQLVGASDADAGLRGLGGAGLGFLGMRIPFVRLDDGDASGVAVVSRDLVIAFGARAVIRLWLPMQPTRPDTDPRWLVEQGAPSSVAEDVGGTSWTVRCPSRIPADAVGWEVQCAAASHLHVVKRLTERLGTWQTEARSAFAQADAAETPDAAVLANLARLGHALQTSLQRVDKVVHSLSGDASDVAIGRLFGLEAQALDQLRDDAQQTAATIREGRQIGEGLARTVQDAMGVVATSSLHRLMEASERQQRVMSRFERRVAILAGALTGPAVVAGLAGANVDFWPLPSDDGTLPAGALPVIVLLCVAIGLAAWRYLRPEE